MEDKKTVAMNEAKARDLQIKISALLNIEKVIPFITRRPLSLTYSYSLGYPGLRRTVTDYRTRSQVTPIIPKAAFRGQRSLGR